MRRTAPGLRRAASLVGVACLLLVGCGGAGGFGEPSPDAVARYGDEEVLYRSFAAFVEQQTDSSPAALEAPVLSSLLDQFLDERLLIRMAADRGLLGEAAAAGEDLEGVGHRRALGALLDAAPPTPATEEALRARYREAEERFVLPERVRLRQILTEDRERAAEAAAALESGEEFGAVARRFSIDPSGPFGGVQGELAQDDLPEEFAEIIFALEPTEVSDIVEADYGFHIFLVTERLPARTVPFEEAAPVLRRQLLEERVDARVGELVAAARNRYTVRVYEDHLSFDYRGVYPTTSPTGARTDP